jgi:hypothetical protein
MVSSGCASRVEAEKRGSVTQSAQRKLERMDLTQRSRSKEHRAHGVREEIGESERQCIGTE